jgi:hypothetical protein
VAYIAFFLFQYDADFRFLGDYEGEDDGEMEYEEGEEGEHHYMDHGDDDDEEGEAR